MKKIKSLNYSNVPGVKESFRIFVKSVLRKVFISTPDRVNKGLITLRQRSIERKIKKITKKDNSKIPKVIHYIWVGGNKKPDSVNEYIKTWKKHCPDYLIVEWNEKNYDMSKNRYTREAYGLRKWAFATDYMRLDILDMFGGVYMDSDIEVLRSLDKFLDKPAFTSFEAGRPDQILMPTGIMGAEPGNSWIRYLKTHYSEERAFDIPGWGIDLTPNTDVITDMTQKKYKIKMNNKFQENEDFTIYPSEYFCPKSWSTGEINLTENSHTIHHFAGSWQ